MSGESVSPAPPKGGRYSFTKNDGLQNQSVLYTTTALDADPTVLLDPNTLSDDGTTSLTGTAVSDDEKLMAYGLATAGSDWNEWKVRGVGRRLSATRPRRPLRQPRPPLLRWARERR